MAKKKLPKGISFNKGMYEARAMIHGHKIRLYGKDLDQLMTEFEMAKENLRNDLHDYTDRMTLDEWFNEWFDKVQARKIKSTSIAPMKNCYKRQFGNYIGRKRIKDIGPMDIQEVINAADNRNEVNSSTKEALTRLNKCFEYAVAGGILSRNPCTFVELPYRKEKAQEETPLSQREEEIFMREIDTSWYKEMFFFMCLTGVRVGELGGLCWSDIDFDRKVIRITHSLTSQYENGEKILLLNTPKTVNSFREIPFIGDMEDVLQSQKKKQRKCRKELGEERWRSKGELNDLVFTSSLGSPCTRYIVQSELNKIVKRINENEAVNAIKEERIPQVFRHLHPHVFRHTFATRCFENGIEPKVVQKLLGHSNISITLNIYTHVLENKMSSELDKLDTNMLKFNRSGFITLDKNERNPILVHSTR